MQGRLRSPTEGTGAQLTDPTDPISPAPSDQAWSPAAALRALSWWLGAMALGGMVFGMYGAQHPFAGNLLAHPLTIFVALAVAGLLILRFSASRPLVSDRFLAAGVVIGIACYFLGAWFGSALQGVR
jgi:predicted lipid-binding transport protein (Tim44 family)